jgi:hypothetical protein
MSIIDFIHLVHGSIACPATLGITVVPALRARNVAVRGESLRYMDSSKNQSLEFS